MTPGFEAPGMCVLITPGRRVMLPSPIVQQKRSWPWIQEPPWFGYTYVHIYSRSFLLCSRFSLRCPTKCCFGGDYALLWSLGAMFFLFSFAGKCGDSGIQPWLCAQLLQKVVVQLLSHQELPFLISWLSTLAANGAANQDMVLSF